MAFKTNEAEKVEKICVCCGKPYMSYPNRHSLYCSKKCLDVVRKRRASELKKANKEMFTALRVDCPNMTEEYLVKRTEQIVHQQDTTIWTTDYAERQKQKTLEMARNAVW